MRETSDAPTTPPPVRLPEDDPLVQRLARWRRERARADGVPAYRVLPNAALLALARERPATVRGLLDVKGIGPARAEKYGLPLLALLAEDAPADASQEPDRNARGRPETEDASL